MIRTKFFHSRSASLIVASYIGKRTKPIWYAIEAFVVLHHVVCGLVHSLWPRLPTKSIDVWSLRALANRNDVARVLGPNHLT